jgi:predicted flap endonuclease-1-like 5' DNA nuclease
MFYTLMKGLVWFLLAMLIGFVIGWLLRSVTAKRQVARARSFNVDVAEMERLRGRVATLEPVVEERDRLRAELDAVSVGGVGQSFAAVATASDLPDASAVLGGSITLDDLTVIEGIGPKIQELCHGIGIRTWHDLSTTEVSLLRTMLADAGARFRTHDPATWPQQAALLAAGKWAEFKALTDGLDGGRPRT